jgi:hypothetical protein
MIGATISCRQIASAAAEMCDVCERVTCLEKSRHLSPTIGTKQHYLTVDLTVKFYQRRLIIMCFKYLQMLETIEWE